MRIGVHLLVLAGIVAALPAHASEQNPAGHWRSTGSPDSVAMLELDSDGSFRFMLTEGALDEQAQGVWSREGQTIRLTSRPRPVRPTLTPAPTAPECEQAFCLVVETTDGSGVAGVEFRITPSEGEPIEGYTQYDGWSTDSFGAGTAMIALSEPIHGIQSQPVAIAPGTRSMRFVLTPNDLGMADFDGIVAEVEGDVLTLQHRLHPIRFRRDGEAR